MARILLIDDDENILKLYKTYLQNEGFEFLSAINAFDGLDILYNYTVDLVLIDVTMPKLNGFQLLERLRRSPRFKTLPVAIFSSRNDKKDIQKAIQLGANEYILKPIRKKEFIEKVKSLLPSVPFTAATKHFVSEDSQDRVAVAKIPLKLLTLTDVGVTLQSPVPFDGLNRIVVENELLDRFGLSGSELDVSSILKNESGSGFVVHADFEKLPEAKRAKIKEWILLRKKVG